MPALQRKTLHRQFVTLAFWLVGLTTFVAAQQLPLKIYTTADGLPSNRISRIVRDSRGYLWFCTENGLSRFDGSRFTNYTPEQGLPDDEVNDLLETRSGAYWIATGNGLCLYHPKGLPLPYGQVSPGSNPMFVVGNLWVGTANGAIKLARGGFTTYTEADGLGSRDICSLMETRSEHLREAPRPFQIRSGQ